jgi:hypothetical protein
VKAKWGLIRIKSPTFTQPRLTSWALWDVHPFQAAKRK